MLLTFLARLQEAVFGVRRTQANLDREIRLSDETTKYYWDVKLGLTTELNPLGVTCPTCTAGRYQRCEGIDGFHPERVDWVGEVHEEFAMMDGRDRA